MIDITKLKKQKDWSKTGANSVGSSTLLGARWLPFNLNHEVKIKVTTRGKKLLREKWGDIPSWWKEDENGFVTIQCHEFMRTFGEEMYNDNMTLPCETTIYIDTKGT